MRILKHRITESTEDVEECERLSVHNEIEFPICNGDRCGCAAVEGNEILFNAIAENHTPAW
ncbi:MAG: hypothetical protein RL069_1562, partial [Planctomycetota bacterium]